MSVTLILKNSLLATACVAGLSLSACASGQHSSSRYGNVYDYESGGSGGNAGCITNNAGDSRYGSGGNTCNFVAQSYAPPAPQVYTGGQTIGGQPVSPGVVYADCSVVNGMNCNQQQPVTVYTPPATTYSGSSYSTGGTATCPTGTTQAGDGTCMQSGGTSYDYTATTTSSYSTGETASCPAGTTSAGDGTCMESGGSSYDYSSSTTSTGYSSGSSYTSGSTSSGGTVNCPAGTTATGNGTCMESSGSSDYGYTTPSTYIPPTTYLPIRK